MEKGWLLGHWQLQHIHLLLCLLCPMQGDRLLQWGHRRAQHHCPLMIIVLQQRKDKAPLLPCLRCKGVKKAISDVP